MKNYPIRLYNPFYKVDVDVDAPICEDFEAIESSGDYKGFFQKYCVLPDPASFAEDASYDPITEEDYFGIRDTLYLMFKLRELATRDDVTSEELSDAGVGVRAGQSISDADDSILFPILDFPVRGKVYARYLLTTIDGEYSDALEHPFDKLPELVHDEDDLFSPDVDSHMTISGDGCMYHLRFVKGFHHMSAFSEKHDAVTNGKIAAVALDMLCSLFLHGVSTFTECGTPRQECLFGISALWLAYCYRLSHIRVTFCHACGKPLLVTGERGTPRQYCDDTCRKWRNRNPDAKNRPMRVRN